MMAAEPTLPSTPAALLELLEKSGGVVEVPDPSPQVRAAWRSLLHLVRRDGHIPDGWHMRQRGRDVGDLVIELRPGEHPINRYRPPATRCVPVPDELTDPHPVVDALRNQPERLPASPRNRTRALMVLQALAQDAQRRGYSVQTGAKTTLMTVVAFDVAFGVEVFEGSGARWTLRLVVRIDGPGTGTNGWADHAKRSVEDEVGVILDEIGRRGSALAAERAEQRRQETERREREHQQAAARHRARTLREQVTTWRLAMDIRRHCDDLVAGGLSPRNDWLRWARCYADDIDPTVDPPGLPDPPSAQDLERERRAQRPQSPAFEPPPPREWHPNRRWYHR